MHAEDRRNQRASPQRAGSARQQPEHHRGIGGVNRGVHEMHRAGARAEHLHIEHQRYPREGMPVCQFGCGKCPADVLQNDPAFDALISNHVFRIVELKKSESRGWQIECKGEHGD